MIYVDDIIVNSNSVSEIDSVKHALDSKFTIKDVGHLKYFLALEIARSDHGIVLSQKKFVLDIITDVGLFNYNPAKSPLSKGLHLALILKTCFLALMFVGDSLEAFCMLTLLDLILAMRFSILVNLWLFLGNLIWLLHCIFSGIFKVGIVKVYSFLYIIILNLLLFVIQIGHLVPFLENLLLVSIFF